MADAIEARVTATRACRSASRDARHTTLKLFWQKPGGYKTVFSFVSAILEGVSTTKWCLQCLDERSPAARKSVESQAGAAASPPLQPAPTDKRPAENNPLDFLLEVSLEPDASADVAASNSSDAGVFRSVEAAGRVFERSPCFSWLLIKAVEAERSSSSDYDSCPQAAAAMELLLGDVVGEGSFAQVKQGVRKHTGEKVAVKILKDEFDEPLDFLREVSICSSLVHPNIVRLVDVLVKPKRTLVFAWAGPTLYEACRKHVVSKANWTAVALQLLAGTAYFHAKFLAHTDLKPKNMCWENGRLTIVDFGQAIVTIPGFRAYYETKQIEKTGLPYGTLNYRSPEVLCGDAAWERPMDIWAAGLVIAEVWSSQNKRPFLAVNSAVDALMSIFCKFGSPEMADLPYFQQLPRFSKQFPVVKPKPLDEVFEEPVPDDCAVFFRGLLCLSPSQRWTSSFAMKHLAGLIAAAAGMRPGVSLAPLVAVAASAPLPAALAAAAAHMQPGVSSAPFAASLASGSSGLPAVVASPSLPAAVATSVSALQPMRLVCEGQTSTFQGSRGPFAIKEGYLAADVLQWLENGLSDEGWSWDKKQPRDRWVEFGNKLEICGHVASLAKRPGLSLNGKDADQPLAPHVVAFALAFKKVNVFSLSALDSRVRHCVLELKKQKVHVGENGEQLLAVAAYTWAWDLAALQVMKSGDREDPIHFDGGASFFHAGITIRGKRTLFCRHGGPASKKKKGRRTDQPSTVAETSKGSPVREPEMQVLADAGHVYIGCLCGPEHYVQHHPVAEHDLYPSRLGPVEITVLLRSRVFRQARGSTQAQGPVPLLLWQALAPVVSEVLKEQLWMLPDLAACQAELAKLKG